jgi:alpha-1,2-glucosyltransferase
MLYLWPLFAFFSAPLIIPPAISTLSAVYTTTIGGSRGKATPKRARNPKSPTPSATLRFVDFFFSRVYYPSFVLGAALLSVGIVKYNTIIHPFTLADNRHYMFYVFRYTILRSHAVRFALVGAYMVSAHLVWSRLAGSPPTSDNHRDVQYINRPFDSRSLVKQPQLQVPRKVNTASAPERKVPVTPEDELAAATWSPPTSAALLWLVTTALSLISAPLVEPRYFILPWVFWRLLVPAWRTPESSQLPLRLRGVPGVERVTALGRRIDLSAVLETVWFVVINLVTFSVFLSRPYQWKTVDGRMLDEARWQRFMW